MTDLERFREFFSGFGLELVEANWHERYEKAFVFKDGGPFRIEWANTEFIFDESTSIFIRIRSFSY